MADKCMRCSSKRIAKIVAKCSDCFSARVMGKSYNGYVPSSEIGSGDYIEFEYCMGCGQIQGAFPEGEDVFFSVEEEDDEQQQDDLLGV